MNVCTTFNPSTERTEWREESTGYKPGIGLKKVTPLHLGHQPFILTLSATWVCTEHACSTEASICHVSFFTQLLLFAWRVLHQRQGTSLDRSLSSELQNESYKHELETIFAPTLRPLPYMPAQTTHLLLKIAAVHHISTHGPPSCNSSEITATNNMGLMFKTKLAVILCREQVGFKTRQKRARALRRCSCSS